MIGGAPAGKALSGKTPHFPLMSKGEKTLIGAGISINEKGEIVGNVVIDVNMICASSKQTFGENPNLKSKP